MRLFTLKKLSYLFIAISMIMISPAECKTNQYAKPKAHVNKSAEIVVDLKTRSIIHAKYADEKRYPASLTKMMTIYIAFEKIKNGQLKFSDLLTTSAKAAKIPYGCVGLKANSKINVQNAILALIVRSSNSASVVLAENIAGSEEKFVQIMNKRAKQLGMHNTNFVNSSGMPNPSQYTTALDMVKLGIALKRDFPEYYHLFSKTNFVCNGQKYFTTNHITKLYPYATGLKTGYINASGYNVVTTAKYGNKDLIAVVMGGETSLKRDYRMAELLDKHLGTSYKNHKMLIVKNARSKVRFASKKTPKKALTNKNNNIKLVRNK